MRPLVASVLFVSILGACDPSDRTPSKGQFTPPCPPEGCQSTPVPGGITVENRSGARITLHVQDADTLRIDRRVVDGTFALPIPQATLRHVRTFTLEAGEKIAVGSEVAVVERGPTRAEERPTEGVVLRVGDGPAQLALGFGTFFVRAASDGSPFIEAADPKRTTLTSTEAPLAECEAGTFVSPPFDDPPLELSQANGIEHGPMRVRRITKDEDGCRAIEIGDDRDVTVATLRACIPDEAYPFTGDDPVFVTGSSYPSASFTIYFRNANGYILSLARVAFGGRTVFATDGLGGIELSAEERADCGRVQDRCGHVDVPVQVTARTDEGDFRPVVYGQPIAHHAKDRTFYVFGGSARPVAHTSCVGDDDGAAPMAQARVWLATVTRGEPLATPEAGAP